MRIAAIALALVTLVLPAAGAQSSVATPVDTTPPIGGSRLFQRSDLYLLAGFGAVTAAMFPLDRHLASVVRDPDLLANRTVADVASGFRFMGGPGPIIIGATMYVAGRATHNRRLAEMAVHGGEAVLVGASTTVILKSVFGRARPHMSADTNPNDFRFGRGTTSSDYQSFPSGHTTVAFSVAAAVTSETRAWWPRYTWLIGTLTYGGATLVGVSRMYHDQHWASDVAIGAAVGTFAGLKTVRFNHARTGNRLDRWFLGSGAAHFSATPGANGALNLGLSSRW